MSVLELKCFISIDGEKELNIDQSEPHLVTLRFDDYFRNIVHLSLWNLGYDLDKDSVAKGWIQIRNWNPIECHSVTDDVRATIADVIDGMEIYVSLRIKIYNTSNSEASASLTEKNLQDTRDIYKHSWSKDVLSTNDFIDTNIPSKHRVQPIKISYRNFHKSLTGSETQSQDEEKDEETSNDCERADERNCGSEVNHETFNMAEKVDKKRKQPNDDDFVINKKFLKQSNKETSLEQFDDTPPLQIEVESENETLNVENESNCQFEDREEPCNKTTIDSEHEREDSESCSVDTNGFTFREIDVENSEDELDVLRDKHTSDNYSSSHDLPTDLRIQKNKSDLSVQSQTEPKLEQNYDLHPPLFCRPRNSKFFPIQSSNCYFPPRPPTMVDNLSYGSHKKLLHLAFMRNLMNFQYPHFVGQSYQPGVEGSRMNFPPQSYSNHRFNCDIETNKKLSKCDSSLSNVSEILDKKNQSPSDDCTRLKRSDKESRSGILNSYQSQDEGDNKSIKDSDKKSLFPPQKKRSRIFIDPITEIPKLENWFSEDTHPPTYMIERFTEDLNNSSYRQRFPKLEAKNLQLWFKNHRAKVRRIYEVSKDSKFTWYQGVHKPYKDHVEANSRQRSQRQSSELPTNEN